MNFRIKEICKEKGILFKDLVARLGITDVGLRQSLQGNPTIGTLEKIAKVLDVEVTELFAPPKQGVVSCPHCGKPINIKIE
jgi:transcriptional regulator with XRE-family HTH domain